MDMHKNADRFTGFAEVYEQARPSVPVYPIVTVLRYLGYRPGRLVDLGCGTGLSTLVWETHCDAVIGIEPSADMLGVARQKAADTVRFIQGYGHDTGLDAGSCDIVVCSQSFHWMEPESTLREIDRILKKGGVFVTIDCDWPPVSTWRADRAYDALYQKVKVLEEELPDVKDTFVRYPKEDHLKNIKNSGYFRYAREVVFSNTEDCTKERFVNLLISQGSLQAILRRHPDSLREDIENLRDTVDRLFETPSFPIDFSYRMRLAVK